MSTLLPCPAKMLFRHAVLLTRNPTKDFYPESGGGGGGVKDLS